MSKSIEVLGMRKQRYISLLCPCLFAWASKEKESSAIEQSSAAVDTSEDYFLNSETETKIDETLDKSIVFSANDTTLEVFWTEKRIGCGPEALNSEPIKGNGSDPDEKDID